MGLGWVNPPRPCASGRVDHLSINKSPINPNLLNLRGGIYASPLPLRGSGPLGFWPGSRGTSPLRPRKQYLKNEKGLQQTHTIMTCSPTPASKSWFSTKSLVFAFSTTNMYCKRSRPTFSNRIKLFRDVFVFKFYEFSTYSIKQSS